MLLSVPEFGVHCDTRRWDRQFRLAGLHGLCVPLAVSAQSRYPGAGTKSVFASVNGVEQHVHTMLRLGENLYDASGVSRVQVSEMLWYYYDVMVSTFPGASVRMFMRDDCFTISNASWLERQNGLNPMRVRREFIEDMVNTMELYRGWA